MRLDTEDDYVAALAEVGRLMKGDPDINTPIADRLNALTEALLDYEARQGWIWPFRI